MNMLVSGNHKELNNFEGIGDKTEEAWWHIRLWTRYYNQFFCWTSSNKVSILQKVWGSVISNRLNMLRRKYTQIYETYNSTSKSTGNYDIGYIENPWLYHVISKQIKKGL